MPADIPDGTLSYQPDREGVAIPVKWTAAQERRLPKLTSIGERRQPNQAFLSFWSAIRKLSHYRPLPSAPKFPVADSPDDNLCYSLPLEIPNRRSK